MLTNPIIKACLTNLSDFTKSSFFLNTNKIHTKLLFRCFHEAVKKEELYKNNKHEHSTLQDQYLVNFISHQS